MYSAQELAQIQADIEECEREAVESGRISTHWPRTPVLGSPRSPVVDPILVKILVDLVF